MHYAHVLSPHVQTAMSNLDRASVGTITPELHTAGGGSESGEVVAIGNQRTKRAA